jgi:hypothetical protein
MLFHEIANLLFPYCGGGQTNGDFVVTLIDNIMEEPADRDDGGNFNPMMNVVPRTLQNYFNGNRPISQTNARAIVQHLDKERFASYVERLSLDALTEIAEKLNQSGVIISVTEVPKVCSELLGNALLKYSGAKSETIIPLHRKQLDLFNMEISNEFTPPLSDWKLVLEVGGECLECGKILAEEKNGRSLPRYSPTIIDVSKSDLLTENKIALCPECHDKYILDTTPDDINRLLDLKNGFINYSSTKSALSENKIPIEVQLEEVLTSIEVTPEANLNRMCDERVYEVERKVYENVLLMRKIRGNALDYFETVETLLKANDRSRKNKFRVFQAKVRACYEEARATETSQEKIYSYLVDWLYRQAGHRHFNACEIIIAFFVQLCDVFEPEREEKIYALTK